MTHASLCKRTYKSTEWFHSTKSPGMRQLSFSRFAFLLFLASGSLLFAQCEEGQPITPASVPNAVVGTGYSVQLMQSNVSMYTEVAWGLYSGSLPPGLTLNTSSMTPTTTITGTPTTA